jgi:hypothetical protein
MLEDIRYALRLLIAKPGFALLAISTLAIGVGANTAIFSVTNQVLLRPLAFNNSDRLAVLWGPTVLLPQRTSMSLRIRTLLIGKLKAEYSRIWRHCLWSKTPRRFGGRHSTGAFAIGCQGVYD